MLQKALQAIAFSLLISLSAHAQGKVFNKDYSKTTSIQAAIETHEGNIVVELDFKAAPNTVANFVELANVGFYNGLTFHRVIQRFMIQGGCPKGNGSGGPGYNIPYEKNDLLHETGVISMANAGDPNTGGSQFFLTQWPQPHLNGKHTVFGRIISGLDVIYLIEQDDPMIKVTITER